MTTALLFGAFWALCLLAAYWKLPDLLPRLHIPVRWALPVIGIVALLARLVPDFALTMGAGYDITSYQIVGDLLRRGGQIYGHPDVVNRYPYLPLQMYWMAFAHWSAEITHLPFVKIVRLAPIAADVGIALLLFKKLRRFGFQAALYGGLLYALNPVPVFVSAYHGQFDAIPALFILLSIYTLDWSSLLAGVWLGLGILNKSWPVLALPSLLTVRGWRNKVYVLVGVTVVPLVGMAVYAAAFDAAPQNVITHALGYNWGIGVWGYTYFFRLLSALKPDFSAPFHWLINYGRYLTLAALALVWLVRARKESPDAGVLTVLVTFLAVTHAFSIQYLMWVVPFAVLAQDHRWLRRYTLGAFAYMFLAYTTLILEMHITQLLPWPWADLLIIMPAGLAVWLVTVGWMVGRVRRPRQTIPK